MFGSIASALIGKVLPKVTDIIDQAVPDKDMAEKLKHKMQMMFLEAGVKEMESATKIIVAEAKSDHWLVASWRPLVMLALTGCIVAHWFGATPENLTAEETAALLEIVKYGLSGYIIGRSAEKGVRAWKSEK